MIGILLAFALIQPPAANGWAFDELIHTNGSNFKGLLLDENAEGVRFQVVTRKPGRPTVTLTTVFTKSEIAKLNRLSDGERTALKAKLIELDPTGKGERERMGSLPLTPTEWLGRAEAAKRYESDHFILVSNASEEITRRAAVRLEQLFAAFRRYVPPRNPNGRPTTIFLSQTPEEYRALLGPDAPKLLNPAIFDPIGNRIVCGSDLRRLGEQLTGTRIHHERQRLAIEQYEDDVRKLYKDQKSDLDRFLATANVQRQRIAIAESANERAFDTVTQQLFAVLYHEAFHAYAATFVYPPLSTEQVKAGLGTGELPRWLNEGLAQLFETAVVEAGELRADYADPVRLAKVKDAIRGKNDLRVVPLSDLLTAGKESFLSKHADQTAAANRAYLTCWAAAYYLTFDRRLLGTAKFRTYLVAINSGGDSRTAFETLVGQPLAVFERDWHAYLLKLKPDGTLAK